jgi:perosamine synthetase
MSEFIPVNLPLIGEREKEYVGECLDTGWVSSEGPFVSRFEAAFAEQVDRRHAVTVCNGSMALEAAVAALRLGPGDEVIAPSFTIISCISAIVKAGATPVLVDCDAETWNMDVSRIERLITPRTRAIMAVHIYGLPVDMDPVLELAGRHGLHVIEDAAEAIGQSYRGRQCGGFGDISIFSFYPNKLVTTGEGGMIVTDDDELASRCRKLRNLFFTAESRFVHEEMGWNLRMTNMQAALGLAQLERLGQHRDRKREIGQRYNERFRQLEGVFLPVERTEYADNIYWVYGVVLKDDVPFDAVRAMLRLGDMQIGTRPFFCPMNRQPVFRNMGLFTDLSCPNAEHIYNRGFYIPSGLGMNDDQIERVADAVEELLA